MLGKEKIWGLVFPHFFPLSGLNKMSSLPKTSLTTVCTEAVEEF